MEKSKGKVNQGCIKIFKLLLLLYNDDATYDNVIEIFKDEMEEQTKNNLQVILNKHLNTLKVFGIKVNKENHKYSLESSFYSMNFDLEDLKSLSILLSVKDFPDNECVESIKFLAHNLKIRMDGESKNLFNNLTENYDFSFYFANFRDQIEQCKAMCKANQQYEITYMKNKKEIKCKCTPKEVSYGSKNAYLNVYVPEDKLKLEIPLSSIRRIKELPQVVNPMESPVTVVFKVKNRLAKSYKVKLNEYSDGYDSDGNQVIINKNEPLDGLISRLMKYGENCEVISPRFFREQMFDAINATLKNYK